MELCLVSFELRLLNDHCSLLEVYKKKSSEGSLHLDQIFLLRSFLELTRDLDCVVLDMLCNPVATWFKVNKMGVALAFFHLHVIGKKLEAVEPLGQGEAIYHHLNSCVEVWDVSMFIFYVMHIPDKFYYNNLR